MPLAGAHRLNWARRTRSCGSASRWRLFRGGPANAHAGGCWRGLDTGSWVFRTVYDAQRLRQVRRGHGCSWFRMCGSGWIDPTENRGGGGWYNRPISRPRCVAMEVAWYGRMADIGGFLTTCVPSLLRASARWRETKCLTCAMLRTVPCVNRELMHLTDAHTIDTHVAIIPVSISHAVGSFSLGTAIAGSLVHVSLTCGAILDESDPSSK